MKFSKTLFVVTLVIGVFVGCASGPHGGTGSSRHQDFQLKNGLKVILIQDNKLPYVSIGLLLSARATQDPVGKSGLNDLVSEMLTRGTKKHTAPELADAFGNLGSRFGSSTDYDFTYFSASGLAEDQNELLGLFFETILEPTFAPEEFKRLKSETIAEIKRSYDQPNSMVGRFYRQLLFGAHPYGRSTTGTVRDVQSIQREDLLAHYQRTYIPNQATVVLVGEFAPDVISRVEALTAQWSAGHVDVEKLPALQPLTNKKILLVTKEDLKQSEVRMGHYGIKRNIDDYLPLMVAETILSGGFSSRLMNEIREKRGLTYGIGTEFDPRLEVGPFVVYTNTRHEKVGEVVRETQKVIDEFYQKGVTRKEVEEAKGYMAGAFPRSIETPSQMAQMLVSLRYYGVSEDYLKNYTSHLSRVTVDDVNRAIKKYYRPDLMQIVVYGPKEAVIDQLRPIGTVEVKTYKELL